MAWGTYASPPNPPPQKNPTITNFYQLSLYAMHSNVSSYSQICFLPAKNVIAPLKILDGSIPPPPQKNIVGLHAYFQLWEPLDILHQEQRCPVFPRFHPRHHQVLTTAAGGPHTTFVAPVPPRSPGTGPSTQYEDTSRRGNSSCWDFPSARSEISC